MIVVLALVAVAVVLAGLAAAGSLASGDNGSGRGGSPSLRLPALLVALGGAAVLLVLVVGAGFLLRGVGGGDHDPPASRPAPVAPLTSRPEPSPQPVESTIPQTRVEESLFALPIVPVQASRPGRPILVLTADGLGADSVVHVKAGGFEPFERGSVDQCVTEFGRTTTCTGRFPVQFGEDGSADFQFQLRTSAAPGECRYGRPTCTVEVAGAASGRRGEVQTVVGEAGRGEITVEPRTGVTEGDTVSVSVAGFPRDTSAVAVLCAPRGGYDARHCTAGPAATPVFRIGADGRGHTELALRTEALGTDRVRCGPRDECGVVVVTQEGFVAAPAVPLEFSLGPGATYNDWRLALGLALALVLVVVAIVLVRRTDWTKPTEAATPEVDAADLQTDHSLDDLFGTDQEIDERDPIAF